MDKPKLSPGEHAIKQSTIKDYEEAKRIRAHLNDDHDPCQWCTRPKGYDACPIHDDHP
jgi:hypothetical protein